MIILNNCKCDEIDTAVKLYIIIYNTEKDIYFKGEGLHCKGETVWNKWYDLYWYVFTTKLKL